jgi:cyanamide hydratase
MREEERLKPWCHSTANEGFIADVEGNVLMQAYE